MQDEERLALAARVRETCIEARRGPTTPRYQKCRAAALMRWRLPVPPAIAVWGALMLLYAHFLA